MSEDYIQIETFDCLSFPQKEATANVLEEFIGSQKNNVFWFSQTSAQKNDAPLAEYNYVDQCWNAGRFIGEADLFFEGEKYRITIKPRFGQKLLFRMLEEIFNIRITSSASQSGRNQEWRHYIKRIIAFIWLQKLSNANLHGMPKVNQKTEYCGTKILGKLDIRKTLKPLYTYDKLFSVYREKNIDRTIAQIIFEAYQILKNDFEIDKITIPDSALEAINQISGFKFKGKYITEYDYRNIRYKDIFLSWKPVVDLSWDIIKRRQLSLKQEAGRNGLGFFIDMAEVWESYLRAILRKKLAPMGWYYRSEKQVAYKGLFFQRELIPDLVFQNGNRVAVWDAKYKRMRGNPIDIDRSDFFQIHSYIQQFLNHREVKSGGLLYPISDSNADFTKYKSPYLMNEEGAKLNFIIDGIELKEEEETETILRLEDDFLDRIINHLN